MSLFDHDRSASLTPVTVLTGFLGSGKTTLLRHLLASPAFSDTAVVINEFGEVGLDHHLVDRVDGEMVVLKSGCVCCSVRSDLVNAVRGLLSARDRQRVPHFERIVIETTGLADPAPIMQTLLANPLLMHFCTLRAVITTIDAPFGEQHLRDMEEARKQVALADRIVLTKLDMTPAARAPLEAAVRELNASAPVFEAVHGVIDADRIMLSAPDGAAWLASLRGHADHGHSRRVDSVVLFADAPLDWLAVQRWLEWLGGAHGESLLRMKGLLDVRGETLPLVVHGVHHVLHPPVTLPAWPTDDRRSRIVLITQGIDVGALRASFEANVIGA